MLISNIRKILTDLLYKHEAFKKDNLTVIEYLKEIVAHLNAPEDSEVPTVIIEILKTNGNYDEKIVYKSKNVRLVIVNNILGHVRTLGEKEIKSLEAKKAER
jgi:hypothetical protein